MLHPQSRRSSLKSFHIRERGLILTLVLAVVALAIVQVSPSVASKNGSPSAAPKGERANPRNAARGIANSAHAVAPLAAPFATIDVDRTDDVAAASACTAAANDCSLRGAVAFANVNPGTTISIPAGTYNLAIAGGAGEGFSGNNTLGDLDIAASNTSIVGAGAATTIINQTMPNDRVIELNPFLDAGFSTNISDVTISGGKETTGVGGGGIISGSIDNSLTLTNCVVSGNSASGAGTFGGGGVSHSGGSLTVTNSTFSGNSTTGSGGAIGFTAGDPISRTPSTGTLNVSGSTFSGNSAGSLAAGGGALDLFNFNLGSGTYTVSSSTFSSNSAPNANGGAIIVESGPLTATASAFTNNTAGVSGGAIMTAASSSVAYSRLVGNTVGIAVNGNTLFQSSGMLTAVDNWWGQNSGPAANDFRSPGGSIVPLTWLELRLSAVPDSVCANGSSSLTGDIKGRSGGGSPLTSELNGLPTFDATFMATLGSISGETDFVNGVATATFTGGATPGVANVDVTADNETVADSVSIENNTTTDPPDQTVCAGEDATFSTTSSGPGPFTYVWKLDGNVIAGATNSSVTITTGSLTPGAHTVEVTATGDCGSATQTATLNVNTAPTVTLNPVSQTKSPGENVTFTAAADGTPTPSVKWEVSTDGGANFNPIPGATSTSLMFTVQASDNGNQYRAVFTNDCGTATTSAATLTTCNPPVIIVTTAELKLWPPNHSYKTFTVSQLVTSVTGNCGSVSGVKIASVSSDEPENGDGDGNTIDDIVIAADCQSVQLRAERQEGGNGRVYRINLFVTDSAGNVATATAYVYAPVSHGETAIDDGPAGGYTVNSNCPLP
jgi:polymorphic membrane protein